MRHVLSEKIYTPEEYLKLVTGEDYTLPATKNQVESIEVFLEEKGYCLWSHDLTEIEHISNDNFGMGVVLVDCIIYNDEIQENEHCYRWFEVEDLEIKYDEKKLKIFVREKVKEVLWLDGRTGHFDDNEINDLVYDLKSDFEGSSFDCSEKCGNCNFDEWYEKFIEDTLIDILKNM